MTHLIDQLTAIIHPWCHRQLDEANALGIQSPGEWSLIKRGKKPATLDRIAGMIETWNDSRPDGAPRMLLVVGSAGGQRIHAIEDDGEE